MVKSVEAGRCDQPDLQELYRAYLPFLHRAVLSNGSIEGTQFENRVPGAQGQVYGLAP
jgi:hypothetical protein